MDVREGARADRASEDNEWRERALRMQAEMDTYRRRQRRIAQDEAQVAQVALLKDVLDIADNLDRALAAAQRTGPQRSQQPSLQRSQQSGLQRSQQSGLQRGQKRAVEQKHVDTLARGIELTRASLERTLAKHGLERIQAIGQAFDPNWHEAVHTVPSTTLGVEPGTVVEVLEAGYRRQDALFRPAKVVVAQ
jgi:molecular chaperone GrpE